MRSISYSIANPASNNIRGGTRASCAGAAVRRQADTILWDGGRQKDITFIRIGIRK